jgi:hypothetical protein
MKQNIDNMFMDVASKYQIFTYNDIITLKNLDYVYVSRYQEIDIDRLIREKQTYILDNLEYNYICKYQRLKTITIYKLISLGYMDRLDFTDLFQYQYLNDEFRDEFKSLSIKDEDFFFKKDTIIHNIGFKNYIIFKVPGRNDYNFMGSFMTLNEIIEIIENYDKKYNGWKKMWLMKISKKINIKG